MRILWFTNTPSRYESGAHAYFGGGWIDSLEALLQDQGALELGISFFHPNDDSKKKRGNVTYYPILRKSAKRTPLRHLYHAWTGKTTEQATTLASLLRVIDDFSPDIIHVFGTEGPFSSVQTCTETPVVIHLQGLLGPCMNAFFPPGQSKLSILSSPTLAIKNLVGIGPFSGYQRNKHAVARESENLRKAKYVMGRTEWDHRIARLHNPGVRYFHINEVLRPPFYRTISTRDPGSNSAPFRIISTLSPILFKGVDLVLKTARLLRNETKLDFEWTVVGLKDADPLLKHLSGSLKIQPHQLNLRFTGAKSPEDLAALLQRNDLFVHPSYIDNSPNSVCEAQIVGLPVIACHVGGVASLITHKETGILIPANGVYELASWITELAEDQMMARQLGSRGRERALIRHDRKAIVSTLQDAYLTITEERACNGY